MWNTTSCSCWLGMLLQVCNELVMGLLWLLHFSSLVHLNNLNLSAFPLFSSWCSSSLDLLYKFLLSFRFFSYHLPFQFSHFHLKFFTSGVNYFLDNFLHFIYDSFDSICYFSNLILYSFILPSCEDTLYLHLLSPSLFLISTWSPYKTHELGGTHW